MMIENAKIIDQQRISKRTGRRSARNDNEKQEKYDAILGAALKEFLAKGYADAKLANIAQEARIAKGTLYLYFTSKQDIFEKLIRSSIHSSINSLEKIAGNEKLSIREKIDLIFKQFSIFLTSSAQLQTIHLALREAHRFPEIASFYYHQIIKRGLSILQKVSFEAEKQGLKHAGGLAKFPQLMIAPVVTSIIWKGILDHFEPLDVEGMLKIHRDIICAALEVNNESKSPNL